MAAGADYKKRQEAGRLPVAGGMESQDLAPRQESPHKTLATTPEIGRHRDFHDRAVPSQRNMKTVPMRQVGGVFKAVFHAIS